MICRLFPVLLLIPLQGHRAYNHFCDERLRDGDEWDLMIQFYTCIKLRYVEKNTAIWIGLYKTRLASVALSLRVL